MSVFEDLRNGVSYDIRNERYQEEVHGEMDRCRQLCFEINATPPENKEKIVEMENILLHGQMKDGTFFTPPFQIDLANRDFYGKP